MCRFVCYLGDPVPLELLVLRPRNSLVNQSLDSRMGATRVNGDGFGIAWYDPLVGPEPGLFRCVSPAWNDTNLAHLARFVRSGCILAHVRAASSGSGVSLENCHPFAAGPYSFMHNGDLGGFQQVRRQLLAQLGEESFRRIRGRTDSEHLFALFLEELGGQEVLADTHELARALEASMRRALELVERHGGPVESSLNLALSDGRSGVVTRYSTRSESPGESLYWSSGRQYRCESGACSMVETGSSGAAVLVGSERLSADPSWAAVPSKHMLLIHPDRTTELRPLAF